LISAKDIVKLTQKKFRREMRLCIIEGEKLVREHGANAVAVFYKKPPTPCGVPPLRKGEELDEKIFRQVSNLETPEGVLAIVKIPANTEITFPYLVLDGVQDPGNVGTLLRTASAFGFKTVFCINCADVWSQKVIRSAMGTQFGLNVFDLDHDEFAKIFSAHLASSKLMLATMPNSGASPFGKGGVANGDGGFSNGGSFGIVLGSEGQGLSAQIRALPHEIVSIPMKSGVESLNVAVAGGILMYLMKGEGK